MNFNPQRVFSVGLGGNPSSPTTNNPRITDFERLRTLLAGAAQTVTIATLDPATAEKWPDAGVVVVRRAGRLDPLTVPFVLGGSVLGGRLHGRYPDLPLGGPDLVTSRGAALPALSVDEYFAELALWLGVAPGNLVDVLPRIENFYTGIGGAAPVGFMNA